MTEEREIHDTPTDRAAMAILLPFLRPPTPLKAETASADDLDAAWTTLAQDLANADDAHVDAILRHVREVRAGSERAGLLMALIIEWRDGTWAAAEIAAGRDPHRTV